MIALGQRSATETGGTYDLSHPVPCSQDGIKSCTKYIETAMRLVVRKMKNDSSTTLNASTDSKSPPKTKQKRFGQQFECRNLSDEYENREE